MSLDVARPVRAIVATTVSILLLVQASGCTGWQTAEQPVPIAVARYPNHQLRVVLTDGWVVAADSARVSDNELVLMPNWYISKRGSGPDPATADSLHRSPAGLVGGQDWDITTAGVIPLSRVVQIQVRQAKPWRTVGLAVGLLVVVPTLLWLLSCSTSQSSYICPE